MTPPHTEGLKELIGKLEKAMEPSFDLDRDIYEAVGAKPPVGTGLYWTSPDGKDQHFAGAIPSFTSSIDAALTLVPEDMWWSIWGDKMFVASVERRDERGQCNFRRTSVAVDNPAQALCIAAFKSRAALGENNGQ